MTSKTKNINFLNEETSFEGTDDLADLLNPETIKANNEA